MNRGIALALALLDACCVVLGLVCAWGFWLWLAPNLQRLVQVQLWELLLPNPWMPAGAVFIVVWVVGLRQLGLHDPGRMGSSVNIVSGVSRSAVAVAVFTIVANFLFAERVYPKGLVIPFIVFSWAWLCVARLGTFRLLLRLETPPTAARALIVGIGEDGSAMAEHIARHARHVCSVAGFLRTETSGAPAVPLEEILGGIDDLPALVNSLDISLIILATRRIARQDALKLAVQADHMGLRVLQAPYSWGAVSPRLGFARIGDLDLIDFVGIQYPTLGEQVKRAFDILAVLAGGAIILLPVLAVAAAVKLQDGGPVFYLAKRVGKGGRTFGFYKFRSMIVNANAMKDSLRDQNETDGRLFKIAKDPRVTPFGQFIRKYSVDELPQLMNVLRGEMNLVGPRALPEEDLRGIEHDPEMRYWFDQRSKVMPGITGLWQVSGRSDLGFADMMRLDIAYIQNWSLWLDLQILVKTVPAVLKGRGAK